MYLLFVLQGEINTPDKVESFKEQKQTMALPSSSSSPDDGIVKIPSFASSSVDVSITDIEVATEGRGGGGGPPVAAGGGIKIGL